MAEVPLRPDAPNTQNPFRHFHNLGWPRLIPLLPVNAPVSPKWEYVNRAIRKHGEERVLGPMWGKAPAARYSDGLWGGFKGWRTYETTDADLDRWFAWGANVGFRMPDDWIIFDIDITDADLADRAEQIIVDMLGSSPCRIGLAPKRMLFYRLTDPVNGGWVFCKAASGDKPMAVEMFSDGRQVALYGMHRAAGRPYQWPRPPIHADDLTLIRPDQYEAVQEALMAALPHSSRTRENKTADRERVSQSALRGAVEDVRRAMEAMPNGRDIFPDRMDYIRMGAALKAALPDDEEEAFDLWCEWAAKDNGGVPELWRKDWNGLGGVFSLGAQWIYEQAERLSGGTFTQAQVHFDPIPETAPSPFDMQAEAEREEQAAPAIHATPFAFPDPAAIPRREWLYGNHYIRKFVSTTVAPSGVGKSSLTIVEALAMASGKPLLGMAPKGLFRVWLWNGEDPMDELQRRVTAAMLHYGLTREDIGDRLFLDSGRDMEIVLASDSRNGAVIAEPNVAAVCRALHANRIDVLTVDPFVSTHRVAENDNMSIDLVTKKWAWIADRCNCGVELVHHVRKMNGNETTVEDSRGAVSLIATSRSARAISKMTRQEAAKLGLEDRAGRLFRFSDGKNNLAPPADLSAAWMQLVSVGLGNGRGDGMEAVLNGDSVGVVALFDGAAQAAATAGHEGDMRAVLAELKAGASGGEGGGWRLDARSPDWAGHAVAAALALDMSAPESKTKATSILQAMKVAGLISFVWKLDAKRRRKQFVEVVGGAEYKCHTNDGVFG